MNFGDMLKFLKQGKKIAREGWNGKGMFLFMVKPILPNPFNHTKETSNLFIHDSICLKTAQNEIIVGWTPNTLDVLAKDWQIVE